MILASDHHIPDEAGYRHALITAADAAGDSGRIVTLGVAPTQPSSAYGYIRPEHAGLAPVEAFIEKPDPHRAAGLILEGCLWNSGAFIATARTLREDLEGEIGARNLTLHAQVRRVMIDTDDRFHRVPPAAGMTVPGLGAVDVEVGREGCATDASFVNDVADELDGFGSVLGDRDDRRGHFRHITVFSWHRPVV